MLWTLLSVTVVVLPVVLALNQFRPKRVSMNRLPVRKEAHVAPSASPAPVPTEISLDVKCVYGRGDAVQVFLERQILDFRTPVAQN